MPDNPETPETQAQPTSGPPRPPLKIGSVEIPAGHKEVVNLPVARLFTGGPLSLSVMALHGRRPGPCLWLDAAIHGDELNGLRIIKDVLLRLDPEHLCGSVLAVPVVNVFGLVNRSRYLPDRRDLNRSFPGSRRGSLASRLARLFVEEVVKRCDVGLDLHTAGSRRTNLPHVRTDLSDPECRRLADAFGAPLIYAAKPIRGSLRAVAKDFGARLLVYEAGEPQRFDRFAIDAGVNGVLRVLAALDMWESAEVPPPQPSKLGTSAKWMRASRSGVFVPDVELGDTVEKGDVLGTLDSPIPTRAHRVKAPFDGLVMGLTVNPLVHQGDALVHLVDLSDNLDSSP
ncbi:MAG: succinylglutamate desuccinylase/aspartoacylase family protein [Acidobacteriota bacterium]